MSGDTDPVTGLPNVSPSILGGVPDVTPGTTPTVPSSGPQVTPRYGIYNGGTEALTGYNSVIGAGYAVDEQVPTYPIENGGFESYNKVAQPFQAKIQYTIYLSALPAFIAQCEAMRQDTNLYSFLTPFYTWQNVNVVHYDWRLQNKRATSMLIVEVFGNEIRPHVTTNIPAGSQSGTPIDPTHTTSPAAQAQVNTGQQQPLPGSPQALTLQSGVYAHISGETAPPQPAPVYRVPS